MAGIFVEWFNATCKPQEGIQLIPLLALTTSIGVVRPTWLSKFNQLFAQILLTVVYASARQALSRLYFEPQIFAYSMPGYFPGLFMTRMYA